MAALGAGRAAAEPAAEPTARWWKGNIHAHSSWSDADEFPEMVAEWYKRRGYHFLGLSDHDMLATEGRWIDPAREKVGTARAERYLKRMGPEWVERRAVNGRTEYRLKTLAEVRRKVERPGGFMLLPAEEVSCTAGDRFVHIGVLNPMAAIPEIKGDSVGAVMRQAVGEAAGQACPSCGHPVLAVVNHPNFHWAVTADEIAEAREARFFEVANVHPSMRNAGDAQHCSTDRMWDIILTRRLTESGGPIIYGIASDDTHDYIKMGPEWSNPGRGWIVVRAALLTPDRILSAMERGDFYASTGVRLRDVRFEGRRLAIRIDPELGVKYTTRFIGTLKGVVPEVPAPVAGDDGIGQVLAQVDGARPEYQMTGDELYVRARVTSTRRRPAAIGDELPFEEAWIQPQGYQM